MTHRILVYSRNRQSRETRIAVNLRFCAPQVGQYFTRGPLATPFMHPLQGTKILHVIITRIPGVACRDHAKRVGGTDPGLFYLALSGRMLSRPTGWSRLFNEALKLTAIRETRDRRQSRRFTQLITEDQVRNPWGRKVP